MAHNNRAGECYLLKPLIVSSKKVVDTTIKMQGNVEIQLERRLIKHTMPTFF
jgi:hypothetical protein